MSVSTDYFSDVAAVYIDGAFGSGRIIAPALVLTAGHVVDHPTRKTAKRKGWKVRLLRERSKKGGWTAPPHEAELVWRGKGDLDLALLRIDGDANPMLMPVFASYDQTGTIDEVQATGFPEAWLTAAGNLRDYTVHGTLRRATQWGPYAWSVAPADKPDHPRGWRGMSGSAVCSIGQDGKLYLFGVVQEVPANFSEGMLEVARLSDGIADKVFASHLRTALGQPPMFFPWERESAYGFTRSGLNKLVEELKRDAAPSAERDELLVKLAGRTAVREQALVNIAKHLGVQNVPLDELGPALIDRIDKLHLAKNQIDALPSNSVIKSLATAAAEEGSLERAVRLLAVGLQQVEAVAAISHGKPDIAIAALEKTVSEQGARLEGGPVDDRIALGYVYKTLEQAFSAKGDKPRADLYLNKALAIFQNLKHETIPDGKTVVPFAEVMNGLGNLSAARNEHKEAIHYYQVATSLVPNYAYAWHDMFLAYYSLAQSGEVHLAEMTDALTKAKKTGVGWPQLTPAYFKRLDELLANFRKANRSSGPAREPRQERRKPVTRKA